MSGVSHLKPVSEEMWFFTYLLEHYAEHKQMATGEALRSWDEAEGNR